MDPSSYLRIINLIEGGKRISRDVYLHIAHPSATRFLVAVAFEKLTSGTVSDEANVIRIGLAPEQPNMSFLCYRNFFEAPFPELQWSQKWQFSKAPGPIRRETNNPPIIHRKELLLQEDDPRRPQYAAVTDALVKAELLPAKDFIGRRSQWNAYLRAHGYEILGDSLVRLRSA